MTSPAVRAVVVDDSATSRALLVELCRSDASIEVVGEGRTGRQAVELVTSLRPSIVVMDIDMPVMDGFEATKQIMASVPTPILIVSGKYEPGDVEFSLRALQMGALAIVPKPPGPSAPDFRQHARRLISLIKALSQVKAVRRMALGPSAARPSPTRPSATPVNAQLGALSTRSGPLNAVAVAASTGGPAALYRFLEQLPSRLSVPVLVVQHIADGFIPGLVSWLESASRLPVKAADHGEPLMDGTVYVAPGHHHLEAAPGGTAALTSGPPVSGFRPSASVLFSSVARVFGSAGAAVVLTGMGDDGLQGARDLRAAGGTVLAQNAGTSVVFGMPRAVAEAGLAQLVAPIDELAHAIGILAEKG